MKVTSKHLSLLHELTEEQFNAVEMHSFLNVISVIRLQLETLQMLSGSANFLDHIIHITDYLTEKIQKGDHKVFFPENIRSYQQKVLKDIDKFETLEKDSRLLAEIDDARTILLEIFKVMDIRSDELHRKTQNPNKWESYSIGEFKEDFNKFFHAVEKNSKGKYQIIQNIANKGLNDYLVNFEVDTDNGNEISMPLAFKDVIRDLIANARKYTQPGGQINIGLSQKTGILRFIVQDNGIGIPENEMDRIFEYGYRGKNVRDRPTMGGGFGLTKALYVTVQLNGDMWIDSKEDEGTTITIELPVRDAG